MKLINLNIETDLHYDLVFDFLRAEDPDVITLQEATKHSQTVLEEAGYFVSYVPRLKKMSVTGEITDGELIATRTPHTLTDHLYYDHGKGELQFEDEADRRQTNQEGLLVAEFEIEEQHFVLATTHFTWTPRGETACEDQKTDMEAFLSFTTTLPPHILTGDFNIPRHHNELYEVLRKTYTDAIPEEYASSMDREIHKHGNNPKLQKLFDDFMVDYIFVQPPYVATDVRLQFGVSDHAAVIAYIEKET